ncbi:MAG TPA: hypothetical protein VEZ12_21450 [Herpetosiphonaceae bacterium]|nr:hypothetical protein [Herpetosiphonaceae bacterium]
MIIELKTPLPCSQIVDHPDMEKPAMCEHAGFVGLVSPLAEGAWELLPLCSAHYEEFITEVPRDAGARPAHVPAAPTANAHGHTGVPSPVRVR